MCFLCDHQYTPIGGWDTDHQNHDDDRPFSHRYCSCAVNSRPHPWVPTAGWLMIPHLKKQLTSNGRTYYGLISLILAWAKLSPYVMRRFPGRVRIVYRLGDAFTYKDAVNPSTCPSEPRRHMYDEAYGEARDTAGILHWLIICEGWRFSIDCINSFVLLVRINAPI